MSGIKGMHARLSTSPDYAERVRARIKAGGIVDRLQKHIAGELEMSKTQVVAAVALLRKVVPDLGVVAHAGPDGKIMDLQLVAYHPAQLPAPALPAPDSEGAGQRH